MERANRPYFGMNSSGRASGEDQGKESGGVRQHTGSQGERRLPRPDRKPGKEALLSEEGSVPTRD